MRFAGKASNEYDGPADLLRCENCGHGQTQPVDREPIRHAACRKCGRTADEE